MLSTCLCASSRISFLLSATEISAIPTVKPARVENLYPKSFIRSNIIDVSVIWNRLNTSAMIWPKFFFLNGDTIGRLAISSLIFAPASRKYLSGVATSRFSIVGSFK